MGSNTAVALVCGAAFLLLFASGYWLRPSSKPYSVLLLTGHKLLGVGLLAYLAVIMRQVIRTAPLLTGHWVLAAFCGAAFLATIASGGLVSTTREMPLAVRWAHKLLPYMALVLSGVTLYFILLR